ncbi:MAG: protein kinase [Planctomycetota bacterium]|nr:protein kinase [Planctomycetota bacterium]
MITRDELDAALLDQISAKVPLALGEIFLSKGYLFPEQLKQILEIQARRLRDESGTTLMTIEESFFGKKVVELGLATDQLVNAGLAEQARRGERGETVRLGQVLVECGVLTAHQVRSVLHKQRKEVLFCPSCYVQYNIVGFDQGASFPCKTCGGELTLPDPSEQAPFDPQTLNYKSVGPGQANIRGTLPDDTSRPSYSRSGEIEGERFGRYRILRKIAQGGMGIVYQALQLDLDRVVALKVLSAGDGASKDQIRRFHREASSAAGLNHPYIVPIHDVGVVDGQHYFTMDYIKGRDLARIIRKGGLPIRDALIITMKVADGLHYAHSQGIVHRDIKPANIILDQLENPRITDFGLVKDLLSDSKVTKTGQVMGTPAYIAPEQVSGEKKIDGRVDVYSLGTVLYELLTSKPPFEAENQVDLVMQVVHDEPPSPRSLNPSIHKDVETICLKCLEKSPLKRYATAGDLQEDIQRYLNGEAIYARPIGWLERFWRKVLRNKAISATVSAAILAVLTISSFAVTAKARAEAGRRENVSQHLRKGRTLFDSSDYTAAILEFEKAMAIDPQSREANIGIQDVERRLLIDHELLIREGNSLYNKRRFEEAESKFAEALRIDDQSEEAKEGNDRVKKALVEVGKVNELQRESESLRLEGVGRAEEARVSPSQQAGAMYVDAVILLRQALAKDRSRDPMSSKSRTSLFELLLQYAEFLLDEKSFDMCYFLLSEAELLEIDPERVELLRIDVDKVSKEYQGYNALLEQGREKLADADYEGAKSAFIQAQEIENSDHVGDLLKRTRYQKGVSEGDAHGSAGFWMEALQAYEVALASASDEDRETVEAKCSRARAEVCTPLTAKADDAQRKGRTVEATELLREVLQIDPSHRLAQSMLAELEKTVEAPKGMVYVPGGEYSLASDPSGRKHLRGSFYLDRFEVTNRQYKEFVDSEGYGREKLWDSEGWVHIEEFKSRDGTPGPQNWSEGSYPGVLANHPVTGISHYEAKAYARWKGKRLPFEWEWEKTASGEAETRRKYPWGDVWDPSIVSSESDQTRAVGGDARDESPFGVRDLGGNVNEWSVGEGDTPVIKGGSFLFRLEAYARCSFRGLPPPLHRSVGTGFRCVSEIRIETNP